jgi:uncharacterized protein (TIGR02246 family)
VLYLELPKPVPEVAVPQDANPSDLAALPQADQVAISTTLFNLMAGFQERDVVKLSDVYSPDADWVNAFGTVKRGRRDILEYLRGLFADDNFNAGRLKGSPEVTFRVLTPNVVVVSAHLQVEGQGLADGGRIELRDNFSLRVLQRQADGTWPIVSEMFNDANREQTYRPGP